LLRRGVLYPLAKLAGLGLILSCAFALGFALCQLLYWASLLAMDRITSPVSGFTTALKGDSPASGATAGIPHIRNGD
jgi:hypothetical protein